MSALPLYFTISFVYFSSYVFTSFTNNYPFEQHLSTCLKIHLMFCNSKICGPGNIELRLLVSQKTFMFLAQIDRLASQARMTCMIVTKPSDHP